MKRGLVGVSTTMLLMSAMAGQATDDVIEIRYEDDDDLVYRPRTIQTCNSVQGPPHPTTRQQRRYLERQAKKQERKDK